MSNILKKVLISEKSFADAAKGKYTFVVDKSADKNGIARMCERLFNITVLSVNSMNIKGKVKITKKIKGKRSDFKKVILTLKAGDKIDLFETESAEDKSKREKEEKKAGKSKETTVKIKEKAKKETPKS